jgi:hypothetical protein
VSGHSSGRGQSVRAYQWAWSGYQVIAVGVVRVSGHSSGRGQGIRA